MQQSSLQNLVKSSRAPRPRITAVVQHRLLSLLLVGASVQELMDETGLSRMTVSYYLAALHKPAEGQNLIHVAAWNGIGKFATREWAWGPGKKDVLYPKQDLNRKNREYRALKRDTKLLGLRSGT